MVSLSTPVCLFRRIRCVKFSLIQFTFTSKIKAAESLLFSYFVFLKSNDHRVSNLKNDIAENIRIEKSVGRIINGVGPVAQSVYRLATDWTVRGSNPGGGGAKFSAPVQTGPGAHPAS